MLQIALGPPLQATKGYSAPERKEAYARAWELCQRVGETPHNFPVLGCPDQALARVHEAVSLFEGLPNPYSLAMALAYLAMIPNTKAEEAEARKPIETEYASKESDFANKFSSR